MLEIGRFSTIDPKKTWRSKNCRFFVENFIFQKTYFDSKTMFWSLGLHIAYFLRLGRPQRVILTQLDEF